MPWFKTDDKLHDHRKTRRALRSSSKRRDAGAMGLWIVAGTWCADNLTDGFVPADELDRWDDNGTALADRLVDAGFWEQVEVDGESGYRFVNWSEHQPTKAQVEELREKKARAGRQGGINSGRTRRSRSEAGASGLVEPPTRPDPTTTAAAAAVRGGSSGPVLNLPGDLDVLRSRLAAHTALAGLRWDKITTDQAARISALIAKHGDKTLVDWALRTCRSTPPVHATAFIGTWEAIGAPRAVEATRPTEVCDVCGLTETACTRASQNVHPDDRHTYTNRTAS